MTRLQQAACIRICEGTFLVPAEFSYLGNWKELWLSRADPSESEKQLKCQYCASSGKRTNLEMFAYACGE